jgi:hypothetical protein
VVRDALSLAFRSPFRSFSRPGDELVARSDQKESQMNFPGKRVLLGSAVAVAALGVGGFAYAAGSDPVPSQDYVTVEDGAATPSPGTEGQAGDGRDCPEKSGAQGQAQPSQPEQAQPEQADPQGNA